MKKIYSTAKCPVIMKLVLLFSITFFTPNIIFCQTIKTSNIHHTQTDETMVIFYDLPQNTDSVRVSLVFKKKSDMAFKYTPNPKLVTGDIGEGKFSGSKKKIVWYWKKEPPHLFTGSGFYFEVTAVKITKSGSSANKKQSEKPAEPSKVIYEPHNDSDDFHFGKQDTVNLSKPENPFDDLPFLQYHQFSEPDSNQIPIRDTLKVKPDAPLQKP